MNTPYLLSVRQFCEEYPAFSESTLRYLIFNRNSNGFEECLVRLNRKILINVDIFFKWLKQNSDHNKRGRYA